MDGKNTFNSGNICFDIEAVRRQFPAFNSIEQNTTSPLVYLDSAATTQKPLCVINAISHYYRQQNANVHRGSHSLTANATAQFEQARNQVQHFINAQHSKEIIWTRGATEAINLIAQTYARSTLQADDEILVGEMEHHANIVPWQIVAKQTGAKVIKVPMTKDCHWDMSVFESLLSTRTKIVAAAHITNVTGTRQPIEKITQAAHEYGAVVVIDGAQGIVHEAVNVQNLDCDFYVFSGHKLYAPTGIGVLYGKLDLLEAMPPWHGGGKMVRHVSFEHTTFAELPAKFEAGTPNVAGAIALATAIGWLQHFNHAELTAYQDALHQQLVDGLNEIEEVTVIGLQTSSSVISFKVTIDHEEVHHQDIATLLDQQNIAVRSGHHCAHPLMEALGINGTVRVSLGIYNNKQDISAFLNALTKSIDLL
ncbi:SufS family cysteine desulfurase [Vibrio sp. S17_S38]|uniref:aminotransferase class V-fold PLP-dependent enzyme n=1 Tax=Vibrio sp. S17_S38 TaxID=2720229 RepID=UPI00167FFCC1|nr:SufS family cysteine desulfurase [Vibrio sp. S17_S38]MBD1572299.1 SufS family cysteine desulfurase [Vibrio sp. S17_S38]